MRLILCSAALVLLAGGAGSALAQAQPQELSQPTTQPSTTTASSASAGAPGDKLICRPMLQNGSLTGRRECHTQRQWETIRLRNQQEINNAQMRGYTSSPH